MDKKEIRNLALQNAVKFNGKANPGAVIGHILGSHPEAKASMKELAKEDILSNFPNIKLSYENITHKKVYSNFVLAIPEGKKCILWFTTNNKGYNICYLLDINDEREITYIKPINLCFNLFIINVGTI